MPPAARNGYGPKYPDRNSRISGSRANDFAAMSYCAFGSAGSIPSRKRIPFFRYDFTSNSPIAAIARYDAIGSGCSHRHVVQPALVDRPAGDPLDSASRPFGTVSAIEYDALSIGWSLDGNQAWATSGSPRTMTPSAVVKAPPSPRSGSRMTLGTPS